jgi:hypothetical protein
LVEQPAATFIKNVFSSAVEHAAFVIPIFESLSKTPLVWQNYRLNKRLYYALALAEIGKIFAIFILVWDSQPLVLFIFGCLMLSLQFTSFQCVVDVNLRRAAQVFGVAILSRVFVRMMFHSIWEVWAFGVIL